MAKVKDNKDKPSYGFKGAVKEKLLGIDPATTGLGPILSESFNAATLFGSESFMAKAFASEEQRERRAAVEKGKPIGFTSEVIEKQTQEQQKITEEQTKEIKEVIEKKKETTPKKAVDPRAKLSDTEIETQTDRVIAKLDEVKAAVVAFSGGMGGGSNTFIPGFGFDNDKDKNKNKNKNKGPRGGRFTRFIRPLLGLGLFEGMPEENSLGGPKPGSFPSVNTKLPEGTRLNSSGRLIDEKTGRFVQEPDDLKQARSAVTDADKDQPDKKKKANVNTTKKATQNTVKKKVRNKLATKFAAKTATKAGFAATGVGSVVSGGMIVYDVGEYAFSKSARMQYDLALGGEEAQDKAFNWLMENDPEVLGVPEQVPLDRRMEYLTLQQDYPDQSEEDILKTMDIDNDAQIKTKKDNRKDMFNMYHQMLQDDGMAGFMGIGLNKEGEEKIKELMALYDEGKVAPEMVDRFNKGLELVNAPFRYDEKGNMVEAAMMEQEAQLPNQAIEEQTDNLNETAAPEGREGVSVIQTGEGQPPVINVDPQVSVVLPREIKPVTESTRRFVSYSQNMA